MSGWLWAMVWLVASLRRWLTRCQPTGGYYCSIALLLRLGVERSAIGVGDKPGSRRATLLK